MKSLIYFHGMRKKIAFVFLAIFLSLCARPVFDQVFVYSFKRYLRDKLQSEHSFEKIQKQKGGWSVYGLKVRKEGVYDFYADRLNLFIGFNWKNFGFLFHIESEYPQLTLLGNIRPSNLGESSNVTFNMTELELSLLQDKSSFCVNFHQKKFSNEAHIEVFSSKKQQSPNLEVHYTRSNVSYIDLNFTNFEVDPYFEVLKTIIKDPSFEFRGILNGSLSIQKKGGVDYFFSNLQLTNAFLFFKERNLLLDVGNARIELEYPGCATSKKLLSKGLFKSIADMRLKAEFEGVKIKPSDKLKDVGLSDLSGFFAYNPMIGPKWDIEGNHYTHKSKEIIKTKGRGFLNSLYANWVEGSISFAESCLASFKLIDDKDSFWKCFTKIDNLSEKQLHLFQALLSGFYPVLADTQLDQISTSMEFFAHSNFESILEFDVFNLVLKGLRVRSNKIVKQLEIPSLNFKGSFNTTSSESLAGVMNIEEGKISCDGFTSLKNICAKLQFEKGILANSEAQMCVNNLTTSLDISGPVNNVVVKGNISGSAKSLIDFFPMQRNALNSFEDRLVIGSFIAKNNDHSELYGELKISEKNNEILRFGLFFQDSIFKELSNGWVNGENISLSGVNLESLQLDGYADFTASFDEKSISFLIKGSDLKIENEDFRFYLPHLGNDGSDSFESVECLQISLDFESHSFSCSSPMKDCIVGLKKYHLDFSNVNGAFSATDHQVNFQLGTAKSHNIDFCGNVLFQTKDLQVFAVTIDTEKIHGKIEDLLVFVSPFNGNINAIRNLKGNFTSPNNGFVFQQKFFGSDSQIFWKLSAEVQDASYSLDNRLLLDQMKGSIKIDSRGFIDFEDLSGKASSTEESISYDLYVPYLLKNKNEIEFDLRLSNSLRDIVRVCGSACHNDSSYQVYLDSSRSSFFSSKLSIDNFTIRNNKIKSLSLISTIDLKDFSQIFSFFKNIAHTSLLDKISFPCLSPIKGILNYSFAYQKGQKSSVEISGDSLKYKQYPIQRFDLKAEMENDIINIFSLNINDINCSLLCRQLDDYLEVQNFSASMQDFFQLKMSFDLHDTLQMNGYFNDIQVNAALLDYIGEKKPSLDGMIKGKGNFSIDLPHSSQKLQIESDLDLQTSDLSYLDYSFENKGPIRAYFSYSDGWILDDLAFNVFNSEKKFTWLECKIGKLLYQPESGKYIYKDAHLFFPKDLFGKITQRSNFTSTDNLGKIIDSCETIFANKEITTEGELDIESSEWIFHIKEHQVNYNDESYLFRNITTKIMPDALIVDSRYVTDTFEFPFNIKFYRDNMHGRLLLYEEDKSPMRFEFDFKNGFQLNSIVGSFHGMDARFQKDKDLSFIGSLSCDFKKIKDFVSPLAAEFFSELDMGYGYELRGKLSFTDEYKFQFNGIFTGKDIEFGGCIYQTLMSNIIMIPNSISLSELKVSDKSGIFKIDKLDIFNKKNIWQFSIPNFEMLDLRPSLLQKIDQPEQEIKPLVFREILLKDLSGELEDKTTYKGYGHLSFINSFKRDHSLLDVPADFLGRIFGLDMELLIPVKGKADFELKNGKFYFSNLEDSYSEGDRSKFFLADKAFPHTMDLNGTLSIHIQMKHYVLFTFTESFILSVEGNLNDPKFSLKKKKTLFSPK